MTSLLISQNVSSKIKSTLASLDYNIITLPPSQALDAPVSTHADMLIFRYGNILLTSREYYASAKSIFDKTEKLGYKTVISRKSQSNKYPNDILFNALQFNGHLYCLERCLSPELAEIYSGRIINVRQGYANCSCATVGGGVITADPSIALAIEADSGNVLRIRQGHIRLPGYDSGFIGGSCFEDDKRICFFGNIDLHPDSLSIRSFCEERKKEVVSLSDEALTDYGSAIIL